MTRIRASIVAACLALATPAVAAQPPDDAAHRAMSEALERAAELPAERPSLPLGGRSGLDERESRTRGEAVRAAHAAAARARSAIDDAPDGAAAGAARAASAHAAGEANADAHAAAGQERAAEARARHGKPPGKGP